MSETEKFLLTIAAGLLVRLLWVNSQWAQTAPARDDLHTFLGGRASAQTKTYTEKIPAGVAGVRRTLEAMRAIVRRDASDPVVRDAAARIVRNVRGHDFAGEVKALFEFVRDEITYRRDPYTVEQVQDARRVLESRHGDCDDKTVLLASLLAALGHKSRFRILGHKRGNYSHVYLEVLLGGRWVPLDPTNENATVGWEAPARAYAVYEVF